MHPYLRLLLTTSLASRRIRRHVLSAHSFPLSGPASLPGTESSHASQRTGVPKAQQARIEHSNGAMKCHLMLGLRHVVKCW